MSGAEDLNPSLTRSLHEARDTSPALLKGDQDQAFLSPRQASLEPEHPPSPSHSTYSWEFLHEDDLPEGDRALPLSTSIVLAGSVDGDQAETTVPVAAKEAREDSLSPPSTVYLVEEEGQEVGSEDDMARLAAAASPAISSLATTDSPGSEGVSDCESHYTNELIAAGEPEDTPAASPQLPKGDSLTASEAGEPAEVQPAALPVVAGPSPPPTQAPSLLTRVCLAAANELVTLTRQVSKMLAALETMGEDCVRGAWATLAGLVAGLQVGLGLGGLSGKRPSLLLPRGLGAAPFLGTASCLDGAEGVARGARTLALRLRKRAAAAAAGSELSAVVAAAGCAAACVALYRSAAQNARLSARLSQRESELAELVSRIMALQRTLTRHHAVRAVPIIAHTTCSWHGVAGASL